MAEMKIQGTRHGWLAALLLLPFFVAAAIFGFFVFLAVLGLAMLTVLVFVVRLWWLRRQLRRQQPESQILEGEYIVVREKRPKDDSVR